jgi:hypothetical protein
MSSCNEVDNLKSATHKNEEADNDRAQPSRRLLVQVCIHFFKFKFESNNWYSTMGDDDSTVDDLRLIDQLSEIIGQFSDIIGRLTRRRRKLKDVILTQAAKIDELNTNTRQLAESVGMLSAENFGLKNGILERDAKIKKLKAELADAESMMRLYRNPAGRCIEKQELTLWSENLQP